MHAVTHAPRSLAELPFERREPLVLLDLRAGPDGTRRDEPNLDYAGFGWAEVDALVLEDAAGERRRLGPVLLLALHGVDEPDPRAESIELMFELQLPPDPAQATGEPEELVVLAPLERFLAVWLPRLPASAPHVVLALCNPLHRSPAWPASLASSSATPRQLHHAHGDVLAWLDVGSDGTQQIRLHAQAWHRRRI